MEVVVVLIIIGIVSVMIIGRSDIGQTDLMAQTEVVKSHIRYAQSRSMNANRIWGIHCEDSGKAYWLFVDGDPANQKRILPGEESLIVDLMAYQLTMTPTTVTFDGRGRPCSDTDGSILQANNISLLMSSGGGATTTISITRNTGFVP